MVCNVAGYSTQSVVQQVFALLLSAINEPQRYAQGVRAGRWARSEYFAYCDQPIRSLEAMTMGILGFGTIGQAVARVALAMGMRVVAHRRSDKPSPIPGVEMVSRKDLLSRSDVVSLHAPATPDTIDMVDADFLASLKDDCILVNTARGTLIVEQDLADWLSTHPSACALLDVLRVEPPAAHHPLYGLTNCIITPHQAWMGTASRQKLLNGLVKNIKNYQSGTLTSLT
jgi:glycerate dehydrogenase